MVGKMLELMDFTLVLAFVSPSFFSIFSFCQFVTTQIEHIVAVVVEISPGDCLTSSNLIPYLIFDDAGSLESRNFSFL